MESELKKLFPCLDGVLKWYVPIIQHQIPGLH